ncbi:50S ribosomal protein L9 [Candidatus Peregrinibacteria bacterium]|nr:50S ribosomal protein L9 [Candidatus Peregrinibacteria bacterium]
MEVLLLDDVTGIGKKNDLLVVGDGFALNFLLPHRRAIVATPTVRKRYAEQIRHRAEEREQEKALRAGAAAAVAGKLVHFVRKVTKTGKLYGAISEKAIAEALKKEHGLDVPLDTIDIPSPIKSTGTFQVGVKMGERRGNVQVVVTADVSS